MAIRENLPETQDYPRGTVLIASVIGVVVSIGSVWIASGGDVFYETLFRVGPTVDGGGIGADWVAGNTVPGLDLLIALVHAADVIMGVFLVVLVLIHWASFRRLASRMRQPGETGDGVVADGGTPGDGGEAE